MTPLSKAELREFVALLREADRQGFPLDKGSYLEQMTVDQLRRLLRRETDA